ncbi:MAG: hypothetical protein IKA94_02075 [Mogibacterium sp.]|nr:hypothetical protein [Prevotella sp.]MBR2225246.1 hypothetical protein [Bacteroidales bacterium]MBR2389565.1 hypothetical protein [Mogibacterium sp.]MBR3595192.1 hypothetical protein [Candidatus Saccharibacteria bacterium]
MKLIHTHAKKGRRSSGFSKPHGNSVSENRLLKRADLQPRKPKTFGQQIHHVQRIVKEHYIGVRRMVSVKLIPHAAE